MKNRYQSRQLEEEKKNALRKKKRGNYVPFSNAQFLP